MKLTTITQLTLDGVTQGNGGPTEDDRKAGFERGGWARGAGDDLFAAVAELKAARDGELQVHGSSQLIQGLLENDLVDEMELITIPVVLGQGARLFADSGRDIAMDMVDARCDSKGVMIQTYRPAGRPAYATF